MIMRKIFDDKQGASAIEVALALPVLAIVMIGMIQFGLVLHLSGGIRHALGEGIRHAKIYPHLSDGTILDYTRAKLPGLERDNITSFTFERGESNNATYGELEISYTVTPIIPFLPKQTIVLNESKRAYLQN